MQLSSGPARAREGSLRHMLFQTRFRSAWRLARSRRLGSCRQPCASGRQCHRIDPLSCGTLGQTARVVKGTRAIDDSSEVKPAMSTQAAMSERGIFMFDPEAERMPREALTAIQTGRLRQTLQRAYADVPHYRKKWDAGKVSPDGFKSIADIMRFPFTTKADLRETYPFGMFAVARAELRRLHASSGTTGKPTVVGYTADDLACWTELMARSLACAGVLPGDIVHNAYGYGLFTGGLGVHYGAERLGCTVVPVSGGGTERQVTLLNDFGANVLCATPSYALNIAEVAAGMGIDLRQSELRVGVFGAEPW